MLHSAIATLRLMLGQPPAKDAVYKGYNYIRQHYIVEAAASHFKRRDDDPAPLYEKMVLDVGCGESSIGEFLALSGATVLAIDSDGTALLKAKQHAETYGAPVDFMQVKAEDLLRHEKKYDVILCLDVLENTPQPDKLIWVIKQLLSPGGMVVFSHINRTFKAWFVHVFLSQWVYRRTARSIRKFTNFYTPETLSQLAQKHGLTAGNIQYLRFNTAEKRWQLSPQPDTRDMLLAALTPPAQAK